MADLEFLPQNSIDSSGFNVEFNNYTSKYQFGDIFIQKIDKIDDSISTGPECSSKRNTQIVEICSETVNPGKKVNAEDFNVVKVIGKGGYGTVYLVKKLTKSFDQGTYYAMKVLKKARLMRNEKNKAHTFSERNILGMLYHPFLVRLIYAFQNNSKLYIVLDYCPGGELFRYLEKEVSISEDAACFYISEIALAIGHLHYIGIIYRDLKPENILLDKAGHVKLTDFGLSKEGVSSTNTFCGTIEYMAPEIILCAGHGQSVDWWSLGTLLYDMLSGGPPFSYDGNKNETSQKILKESVRFPPSFSPEVVSLISGLLNKNPRIRLGSKLDLKEIKEHVFFECHKINWSDVLNRKLKPPFMPELSSDGDVSMFDPTFTQLQPILSPASSVECVDPEIFQGFSYVASGILEPSSSPSVDLHFPNTTLCCRFESSPSRHINEHHDIRSIGLQQTYPQYANGFQTKNTYQDSQITPNGAMLSDFSDIVNSGKCLQNECEKSKNNCDYQLIKNFIKTFTHQMNEDNIPGTKNIRLPWCSSRGHVATSGFSENKKRIVGARKMEKCSHPPASGCIKASSSLNKTVDAKLAQPTPESSFVRLNFQALHNPHTYSTTHPSIIPNNHISTHTPSRAQVFLANSPMLNHSPFLAITGDPSLDVHKYHSHNSTNNYKCSIM